MALEKVFNRQELLKFLLDVAVKATRSSAGSVMLYSPEANELYIGYATGLSDRVVKGTRQKLGEGIAGTVAQLKEARLIRSPDDDSLYAGDRERVTIASALSAPLMWQERLLGVVNVSTNKSEYQHDERDLDQLKGLSRRLSRVLFESLRLQELQIQHRETRFQRTMGELAEKKVSTNEKFSILSQYLSELMGADTVEIYVATGEGDWYVLGGSNRVLTPKTERIRTHRGALGRAFLEQRCLILSESGASDDPLATVSSVVYCHMPFKQRGAVVALEFSERYKLDEFLVIQEPIVRELSRFVASELRERALRRKLQAFAAVSDSGAALLACRTTSDLADVTARVVSDVLECDRVSVRLRTDKDEAMYCHLLGPPGESPDEWQVEDDERFEKLSRSREPFSIAFLDFDAQVRVEPSDYHSLLAWPILSDTESLGGIIAYEKRPRDPMEDAVFNELDQEVLAHLTRLILPVLETVGEREPSEAQREPKAYDMLLEHNVERLRRILESEIARSDRYHHTFSLILFRIEALERVFEDDHKLAFGIIDDITQGIRTRTRKTDAGCWINRSTYAMLSLDGGQRIRFLISRALLYLEKDLTNLDQGIGREDILVGYATYPRTARTADDLVHEAEKSLRQPSPE
jgi:GAF domain-containing protein